MADIKIKRAKLHDNCILIVSLEIMTHSYPQKIGGDSDFHSNFNVAYLYFLSLTTSLIAARMTRSIVFAWQINFRCFFINLFVYAQNKTRRALCFSNDKWRKLLCHAFTTRHLSNLIIFKLAHFKKIQKKKHSFFSLLDSGSYFHTKMKSEAG